MPHSKLEQFKPGDPVILQVEATPTKRGIFNRNSPKTKTEEPGIFTIIGKVPVLVQQIEKDFWKIVKITDDLLEQVQPAAEAAAGILERIAEIFQEIPKRIEEDGHIYELTIVHHQNGEETAAYWALDQQYGEGKRWEGVEAARSKTKLGARSNLKYQLKELKLL